MQFFKRNPFGHILFLKKWLIRILGAYSHRRYRGFNELKIEGSEIIRNLNDSNVLFISNHQTYFADVVAMFHVFNASLKGRVDSNEEIGSHENAKLLGHLQKYSKAIPPIVLAMSLLEGEIEGYFEKVVKIFCET